MVDSMGLATAGAIETELQERLKKGVYGDIYNYSELEWNKVLDEEKQVAEGVEEEEEENYQELEIEYVMPPLETTMVLN
ncbi:hypothetical protein Bca101_026595 [Brassica carinata]